MRPHALSVKSGAPAEERAAARRAAWAARLCAVLAIPLLLGFFGALHPAFDSFSHFRAHLAVLLAAAALAALFLDARAVGTAALLFAAAAFATTVTTLGLPFSGPPVVKLEPVSETNPVYRLLQMNVEFDNPTPEKVLSLIGRLRPDVVAVDEITPAWAERLRLIAAAYPQQVICPTTIPIGGVAILALRPFTGDNPSRCTDRGAFATARLDFGGRPVEITALHLGWPWPSDQFWQINRIAGALSALDETTLLAGDFNAVQWSAAVGKVARFGRLKLVAPLGPTWLHKSLPVGLRRYIGLPIDHVMTKGDIIVHAARTLEAVGSDHAPVLVEFSVRRPAKPAAPPVQTAALRTGG